MAILKTPYLDLQLYKGAGIVSLGTRLLIKLFEPSEYVVHRSSKLPGCHIGIAASFMIANWLRYHMSCMR